nr:F-box domain, cyclin-like protein [Tanacetum cinerariifolium]
ATKPLSLKPDYNIEIDPWTVLDDGAGSPGNSYTLPKTLKALKLDMRVLLGTPTFGPTLTHISLVLDIITDIIVFTIVNTCPLLVDLELIDTPTSSTWSDGLSNVGVQEPRACRHLVLGLKVFLMPLELLLLKYKVNFAVEVSDAHELQENILSSYY